MPRSRAPPAYPPRTPVLQRSYSCSMHVPLQAPLDIGSSLELFRRSGDDLIDRWDGVRLVRALTTGTNCIPFLATATGDVDTPGFEVQTSAAHKDLIRETVETTFAPAPAAYERLLERDPVLAA